MIVVNYLQREKRFAVMDGRVVKKLVIEQPKQQSAVGSIYVGIVTKVMPGLNAVFVDIGEEKQGFLHRDKMVAYRRSELVGKGMKSVGSFAHQGERLLVQVEKDATNDKGPRLTGIIKNTNLEEIESAARSQKKPGILLNNEYFLKELQAHINKLEVGTIVIDDSQLKQKLVLTPEQQWQLHTKKENIFHYYGVEHEIEKALKRVVLLNNGAYVVIDETEALTVIDVNTGSFTGKHQLRDTILKTNELAAYEVARQIQLRDMGGIILVDFIDMKEDQDRDYIQNLLRESLTDDKHRTKIIGFTDLGIMQLTRQKTKKALAEELMATCPTCEGTGKIFSSETVCFRLERELWELRGLDYEKVEIETTKEIRDIFSGVGSAHLQRFEAQMGFTISFVIQERDKPYYCIRKLI